MIESSKGDGQAALGGPAGPFVTRASIFERLRSPQSQQRELAWKEFAACYGPIIAGFAKRCGASSQDIDDVVQEVTKSFFAVSGEFIYDPARGRFRGWLKTCTVRASIRVAGKNLRYQGVPLADMPQTDQAVEPVWNDVWEQQLVARALELLRQSANNSMPLRAFEQYVLLDRPAEVVAEELGTTVANVHQAKSRMTKRLRDLVAQLRETEE